MAARRSNACIAIRSSMTICRRWTMTISGAASPPRTRHSTRRPPSSPATGFSLSLSTSCADRNPSEPGGAHGAVLALARATASAAWRAARCSTSKRREGPRANGGRCPQAAGDEDRRAAALRLRGRRHPGRASEKNTRRSRSYGDALGEAFQIADDLLDVEGDPAIVGKATGKDQEAGKGTLVSLLGLEAAHAKLQDLKNEALTALAPFRPHEAMLAGAAEFMVARKF